MCLPLHLDDYRRRKEDRRVEYNKNVGRRNVTCVSCNGSGYYDHNGSPECSSCDGTGKDWEADY